MSSKLPADVERAFHRRHRNWRGLYRCVHCARRFPRTGIHIDHRRPEADFPDLKHDVNNLQPLCIPCHKIKTSKENSQRARLKQGVGAGRVNWWGLAPIGTGAAILWHLWLSLTGGDTGQPVKAALVAVVALSAYFWLRWYLGLTQAPSGPPGPSGGHERVAREARTILGNRGVLTVAGRVPADFTLTYAGTGFEDAKDDNRTALVDHLGGKLGCRLQASWDTSKDRVHLVRRPDLPSLVEHPGFAKRATWERVPIGPSTVIDFSVTSHVLIIGPTNSGKTVVIRSVVEAFIDAGRRFGAEVRLADPKMIELLGFEGLDGVTELATDDRQLWDLPINAKAEMMRRFALFRDERVPLTSHRPLLIVVDEYEEFVRRMNAFWLSGESPVGKKQAGAKNPCLEAMISVLAMARRAHMHVVIGTQRPDASWFGGAARDNLQGRIGVGRLSLDAARMLYGTSEYGRDVPAQAKGRITVQMGNGAVVEDQAFWVPDRVVPDLGAVDRAILNRLAAPAR